MGMAVHPIPENIHRRMCEIICSFNLLPQERVRLMVLAKRKNYSEVAEWVANNKDLYNEWIDGLAGKERGWINLYELHCYGKIKTKPASMVNIDYTQKLIKEEEMEARKDRKEKKSWW